MVPKIGPRMSNVLWASYCDLLKWQLLMPGREEKARGWHSGLRAGDQTPLRRMGLTSCVTRQIMVTGWQALAAQGRLKRRTTSLDIFSPFFFFFLSLHSNHCKSCMFARRGNTAAHTAHSRLQKAGDWFPFEIQWEKYAFVHLADTITNAQWIKTVRTVMSGRCAL